MAKGIFCHSNLVREESNLQASTFLQTTGYNSALAALICEDHAAGMSLANCCRRPGFPSRRTVAEWADNNPDFAETLNKCKLLYADSLVEEMLVIADDSSDDYRDVTRRDGSVERVFDHEHASRSKLRVDVRKFVASRLNRDQWGDSKHIDIDAKILNVHLTDDELDKRLEQARAKLIDITPNPLITLETGEQP